QVGQHQFGVDGFDVADGVDRSLDVGDVGILEAADDVQDGVDIANVGKEFVTQSFPHRGPPHDASDVDQLQDGGDHLLGRDVLLDELQAAVGNRHGPHVGLDGAKGVVLAGDTRRRQGVEQSAFADVRQSNDACLHNLKIPCCG